MALYKLILFQLGKLNTGEESSNQASESFKQGETKGANEEDFCSELHSAETFNSSSTKRELELPCTPRT